MLRRCFDKHVHVVMIGNWDCIRNLRRVIDIIDKCCTRITALKVFWIGIKKGTLLNKLEIKIQILKGGKSEPPPLSSLTFISNVQDDV
jgi:hypothetical protein